MRDSVRQVGVAGLLVLVAVLLARVEGGSVPAGPSAAIAAGETCTPARPHASGTGVQNVSTPNGMRPYRVHVPPSYTGSDPVPLVVNMHGAGSNALEQEIYSGFSAKSDAEGFIVAYPEGMVAAVPFTHFNAWQLPAPGEPDDVAYINAILNALNAQLCLDQSRVYSTGLSNGAMMSVRLACSLSARIAAIAPVAGSYFPPMALNVNPAETCPDAVARPFLAFHGTADASVPYNGGSGTSGPDYRLPIDDATPADDVLSSWAAHNGCGGARQETQIDTEVRLVEYGACAGGVATRLYAVDGGGHTWPGSFDVPSLGYVTQQIDATDLIWDFFSNYTLPDADADLIPDAVDNCIAAANFGQENAGRNFIDNSPPYAASNDDRTSANSDLEGDACDTDDDNDGALDADELSGLACAGAITDPLDPDSDGDRFLDGAECALGSNPADGGSVPAITACGATSDADGDRVATRIEVCFYNTDPNAADTDGDAAVDGARDGCEVASFNADRIVNSLDQAMLAQGIIGFVPYHANVDINKDGVLNSLDQGLQAQFILPPGQCP